MMKTKAVLFSFFLLPGLAWAGPLFIDTSVFYYTDSMKAASTTKNDLTFYDFTIGFGVDSKGQFQIGWDYVSHSTSEDNGTSTTYAGTEMGPRFIYHIGKDRNWRVSLAYNLQTSANYNNGSAATWTGSAIFGDLGYDFRGTDKQGVGLRLNYSSATYTQQVVGGATYTKVSYSRTLMYPAISYTYDFN